MGKKEMGMNKEQWKLFYDVFGRNYELIKEGVRGHNNRYAILLKEFGHRKYFVRKEDQPKLKVGRTRSFAIGRDKSENRK